METSRQHAEANLADRSTQAMRDLAFDLACHAFNDPTEEHVDAVYARLVWNSERGLGAIGAVTVH